MSDSPGSSCVVKRERSRRSQLVRALAPALAVLGAALPAAADDPRQPAQATAQPTPGVTFGAPPARDYDAADPDRNTLTLLHAAANVVLLNYIIWQYDWLSNKETVYWITGRDLVNNHIGGFPFDTDNLAANFLGHPIDGAMYHGAARATGLSFWETTPFVVGGSFMWELLSENQKPATNDLISTSLGGICLGESLYRLSSLALDDSKSGVARLTRELAAFLIAPSRGANRLGTGEAWADGAPPIRKPARVAAHAGVDRVGAGSVTDGARFAPSVLLAVSAEYGDLLPAPFKRTIGAYDFFDFYAGGLITTQSTSGFEFGTVGLLHGWSADVSTDGGALRDNNVVGFVQSFDYQGADAIEFAAMGLGVGDFLSLRGTSHERLRLGGDFGWSPLAAMPGKVNPYVGTTQPRDYNFSMGATLGVGVRWDMARVGRLGLWAREYGTTVIDGIRGQELFGYARLWYEVDAVRDVFGVGIAPKVMHRFGSYTRGRSDEATQLSLQFYATVRL